MTNPKRSSLHDLLQVVEEKKRREAEREGAAPAPEPPTSTVKLRSPEAAPNDKSNTSGLANSARLAKFARLANFASGDWQISDQAKFADQANFANLRENPAPDLFAGLPAAKGFLRLSYQLIDHLFPLLDPSEQAVYLHLLRLSFGFNKPTCVISYGGLARRSGMSARSVQDVLKRLEAKGLAERVGRVIGGNREQGNEFRLAIPANQMNFGRLAKFANIIETQIKETHTNRKIVVCVSSNATLEQCRKYADHLHKTGQGITNPGGYATKIHRSGEADALIAEFLKSKTSPGGATKGKIDVSTCPDCRGTGFWEPGGAGKGVARCKHRSLQPKAQKGEDRREENENAP